MISLNVVEALLSSNGQLRQAAEAHLQSLDVNQRVFGWVSVWRELEQVQQPTPVINTAVPQMIAVLWRRDILKCSTNVAALLDPLQQIFVSDTAIVADEKVRSAVGYCLAEVVALVQTSAALEQTLQATQSLLAVHPGPVLELLQALGRALPGEMWTPPVVTWVLDRIQTLQPPSSGGSGGFETAGSIARVSRRTIQVIDTLVAVASDETVLHRVEAILQPWLAQTTDVETLSHLIENTGSHFGKMSDSFWQLVWQKVQPHSTSEPRLVCQALEQMVSILTQDAQVLEAMRILLQILSTAVDEDMEDWSAVEWLEEDSYEVDHDEEGVTAYAIDVLNQWLNVHEKQLPAFLNMLQSTDQSNWRSVWSTITAWQCCLTALPVALEANAPALYQGLCATIVNNGNHVRVRHQAWQTFAGMVETYPQVLSDMDWLSSAIRHGLVDGHPRVTAVVCRVISSVALSKTEEEPTWSHGQLDLILQGLVGGPLSPQAPCRLVVVRGLKAVAALANSAQIDPFFDPIMHLLLEWSNREASVTGDALEAAAFVAQSLVEEESLIDHVRSESSKVMDRILFLLQQGGPNIEKEPLLVACARLATVLEDAFQPCLPTVVGLLLEKITAKDDIEFAEGDSTGLDLTRRGEFEEGTLTVHVPGQGLAKLTLHTSQIEEKTKAIRALYTLLAAVPSLWAPFFQATYNALEPLLNYAYHADIRTTAAQSMAALLEAGLSSEELQVWTALTKAALTVSKQLTNEANTEPEDWFALADSLSEMLYSAYSRKEESLLQNITASVADQIVLHCGQALQKCLERRTVIATSLSNSRSPDEQAALRQELLEEQKLLTPLVDAIGYTLKILGPSFFAIFEKKVEPLFGPFLGQCVDKRARWSAVCLFDDCVEHCGPQAAARFAPKLLPAVLSGMQDTEDKDLQRASIYGIAQIARYAPTAFSAAHAGTVIPALASISSQPKASVDDASVHENSVSALASLVLFPSAPFRGKFVKLEVATKILLDNLPLEEDYDEAKVCSAGLCDLIESGTIPASGYTKQLVEVIGKTLAEVSAGEDVATESDCARMSSILIRLQSISSADLEAAFNQLSPECQAAIHSSIQQYSQAQRRVVTP